MDAITPTDAARMLARYQHFRKVGRRLTSQLVASLDKAAIQEAGRKLGILQKDTLYFDTEDAAAVLMDYAICHVRRDGLNAVERHLAASPPQAESDEMRLLRAMCEVRYSLFQVKQVFRGFVLELCDILRDDTGLLIDVSFSQTARRGFVLATHLHPLEDFWMTTGAPLPVLGDLLEGLLRQIERRFGKSPQDFREMWQEQETELATLVIRTCLREGVSERVSYAEPQLHRAHGSPPAPASQRARVGRNDPCPCGSGRKYKNCCRRKHTRRGT